MRNLVGRLFSVQIGIGQHARTFGAPGVRCSPRLKLFLPRFICHGSVWLTRTLIPSDKMDHGSCELNRLTNPGQRKRHES